MFQIFGDHWIGLVVEKCVLGRFLVKLLLLKDERKILRWVVVDLDGNHKLFGHDNLSFECRLCEFCQYLVLNIEKM